VSYFAAICQADREEAHAASYASESEAQERRQERRFRLQTSTATIAKVPGPSRSPTQRPTPPVVVVSATAPDALDPQQANHEIASSLRRSRAAYDAMRKRIAEITAALNSLH
jgi:hypothetical protein